jgi:hypothetical protein
MECEAIKTHLSDHLAGTLSPALAEEVTAHLRSCATCAADAAGLEDTWQALGTLPGERPNSSAMRARFDAMLAGYQEAANPKGPAEAGRHVVLRFPAPMRYAAWMSAAAAVLVLGVAIGRQTAAPQVNPADAQLAVLREELRTMREMMTISLLQQQSASERLRGVSLAEGIDTPGNQLAMLLVDTLLHDPNDNVRLRTVETLRRFSDQDPVRRGTLDALGRPASPMVQMELVDFVLEVYGRDAAGAVQRLAMDPMVNEAVRARATQGLARLGV